MGDRSAWRKGLEQALRCRLTNPKPACSTYLNYCKRPNRYKRAANILELGSHNPTVGATWFGTKSRKRYLLYLAFHYLQRRCIRDKFVVIAVRLGSMICKASLAEMGSYIFPICHYRRLSRSDLDLVSRNDGTPEASVLVYRSIQRIPFASCDPPFSTQSTVLSRGR